MQRTALKLTVAALCLCALTNKANGQTSGNCGNGVDWAITGTAPNQTLHISYDGIGTGAMTGYSMFTHAPWYSQRADLKTLVIDSGVTSIGSYAFNSCSNLDGSITIPSTITYIGDCAFNNCSSLDTVNFNAINCTYMGSYGDRVFEYCNLTTLKIGSQVQTIPNYAFAQCHLTGTLTIPISVKFIGNSAFTHCDFTGNLIIPDSVASIDGYAFYGCNGLSSVTIGSSVTTIGNYAFCNCSTLVSIASYAVTPPSLGTDAFIAVPSNIPVYVPCGSLGSYQTAWSYFSNIVCSYRLNVLSNDNALGSVVGGGAYIPNSNVNLYVAAKTNAYFTGWADGDNSNPRTISLTKDTTLTANFALHNIAGLNQQIADLEQDTATLNGIIAGLQNDTSACNQNTIDLLSQIDNLENDTANLNLQIANLIADTVRLFGEILPLKEENFLLKDTISDLKQALDDCLKGVSVPSIVQKEFKIYPNPTTGLLTIEKANGVIERIDIFEITGRFLQSTIVNQQSITIDITHLANGMYYLKIDNVVVKIVKN